MDYVPLKTIPFKGNTQKQYRYPMFLQENGMKLHHFLQQFVLPQEIWIKANMISKSWYIDFIPLCDGKDRKSTELEEFWKKTHNPPTKNLKIVNLHKSFE